MANATTRTLPNPKTPELTRKRIADLQAEYWTEGIAPGRQKELKSQIAKLEDHFAELTAPPKPPARTDTILMRLTVEEKRAIIKAAEKTKTTPSDFARTSAVAAASAK